MIECYYHPDTWVPRWSDPGRYWSRSVFNIVGASRSWKVPLTFSEDNTELILPGLLIGRIIHQTAKFEKKLSQRLYSYDIRTFQTAIDQTKTHLQPRTDGEEIIYYTLM